MAWPHADLELSRAATLLLGRQCYVCPGYDHLTQEPLFMVADGVNAPVYVNEVEELQAAVAEFAAGLGFPIA